MPKPNNPTGDISSTSSEELLKAMAEIQATDPTLPQYMVAGPVEFSMIKAAIDFQGRDRRRIKREMNKAAKGARKANFGKPHLIRFDPFPEYAHAAVDLPRVDTSKQPF